MTTFLGQGFIFFGAVVYLLEGLGVVTDAAGAQHPRFLLLLLVAGAACASVSYFVQLWYHVRGRLYKIPAVSWYAITALVAVSWIVPLVVAVLIAMNGTRQRVAFSTGLTNCAPIEKCLLLTPMMQNNVVGLRE